jgi:uncharacterized protein DUF3800
LYLAYVDDSGDENCDLLGAVMLPLDSWRDCLRVWLNWRRFLFRRWGIPADFELHAVDFLRLHKHPIPTNHSRGGIVESSGINSQAGQRHEVYRRSLNAIRYIPGVRVATVCRPGSDRLSTYQGLLEAFQGTMEETEQDVLVMVDGAKPDPRLRGEHRMLKLKDRRVIEDPWPERSHNSQLLQIADLAVHAAYQHVVRHPNRRFMWDWYPRELSTAVRFDLGDGCACGIDTH